MAKTYFTPHLFEFLRDLKQNNTREWFQDHKLRYQTEVQEPILAFISDFGPRLERISAHFVADPRKVGGSMFRIYRDVRFSKDKSPYKTAASAHFRHREGKDVHCPGFYLHLEPGRVFAGTGIWRPDGPTLLKIRHAMVADSAAWRAATTSAPFLAEHRLDGDSLKRAPKGFDPNHELIGDLRRKDVCSIVELDEKQACAPGFLDRFAGVCGAAESFMAFLCRAIGVAW
jgi:uncharacterized protein (TIGR02453 family)